MRRYIILDYIQARIDSAVEEMDILTTNRSYLGVHTAIRLRYDVLARRVDRLQSAYDKVSDKYYLA